MRGKRYLRIVVALLCSLPFRALAQKAVETENPRSAQMSLAAEFSSGRIRAGLPPPKTARTEQLSIMARDQSIREQRKSQSSRAKWIKSQIPASCQSRSRLQQVMPEPQANCLGTARSQPPACINCQFPSADK
jgi:hypothetical protein